MENGDTPWKKMIGDYLLQRLGVPTEYFEVMADARELNGWRDREDICLVVFEQPQKAQQLQKSGGKAHGFNRGMKAKKLFAIIGQ